MPDSTNPELIPLTSLSRKQRRVLGVLLEKAFTVPDQYPMTVKATTTGCNQKNNRDPISSYDEADVFQTLEELQQLGFVGCLHTEGGRTERFRHYMRLRTTLTGPQLAIMTELLLRGKQQLGELRTRASRMVQIESQDELRADLQVLLDAKLVRANGPLERRGMEVDHDLYGTDEKHQPLPSLNEDPDSKHRLDSTSPRFDRPARSLTASEIAPASAQHHDFDQRLAALESTVRDLQVDVAALRRELHSQKHPIGDHDREHSKVD